MNMMSVLLGATGLLLVAALILSMGSMNSSSDAEEFAKLRAEIDEMKRAERDLASRRLIPIPTPTPPTPAPVVTSDPVREAELAAENAELLAQLEEKNIQERILKKEADLLTNRDREKTNSSARRARTIDNALLIATVIEYAKTEEGEFVVVNIQRHDNSQVGTELAIRRNSGIVGHVKISHLYENSQASADPIVGTFLGAPIDIRPGDELIVPPL